MKVNRVTAKGMILAAEQGARVICSDALIDLDIGAALFEYKSKGAGQLFQDMIVSPSYCVDRLGNATYVGDDRFPLRWGDARA